MAIGQCQHLHQLRRTGAAPDAFRDRLAIDPHHEAPEQQNLTHRHTATVGRGGTLGEHAMPTVGFIQPRERKA